MVASPSLFNAKRPTPKKPSEDGPRSLARQNDRLQREVAELVAELEARREEWNRGRVEVERCRDVLAYCDALIAVAREIGAMVGQAKGVAAIEERVGSKHLDDAAARLRSLIEQIAEARGAITEDETKDAPGPCAEEAAA